MRKQQLANLKIGDKVQEYKKGIYTVMALPTEGVENSRFKLEGTANHQNSPEGTVHSIGIIKGVSESTLLKNYKLIEEEPQEQIAVTVEEVDPTQPEHRNISLEDQVKEEIVKVKEKIKKLDKKPEDNLISVSDMARELGMTPSDARRILRKAAYQKPEQGWKFTPGSDEYNSILNTLKGIQEKRNTKA